MENEFRKTFFALIPLINEILEIIIIHGIGFLPRILAVLPLSIILYFFVVIPLVYFIVP